MLAKGSVGNSVSSCKHIYSVQQISKSNITSHRQKLYQFSATIVELIHIVSTKEIKPNLIIFTWHANTNTQNTTILRC